MKQIIDKLVLLEREITSEQGAFTLFALVLPEDAAGTWDLLASAAWLDVNKKESLEYLVSRIHSQLDIQELLKLSRIVLLEADNPVLKAMHQTVRVQHGMAEMKDQIFSGMPIKHAYVITSDQAASASKPTPQPT